MKIRHQIINVERIQGITSSVYNLIGTLGISEFEPKKGQVFQNDVMSLC